MLRGRACVLRGLQPVDVVDVLPQQHHLLLVGMHLVLGGLQAGVI